MTLAPSARLPVFQKAPALLAWTALVVGSLTVIGILHPLGSSPDFAVDWKHLWAWTEATPAERVILSLGRVTALALAYWLLATTVLYTAAQATRIPAVVRSVEWSTLPAVRRLAERVVALSLVVSGISANTPFAMAGTDPTGTGDESPDGVVLVVEPDQAPRPVHLPVPAGGSDVPLRHSPTRTESAATPMTMVPPPFEPPPPSPVHATPDTPPEPAPPASPDEPDAVREHTVRAGESLWLIAEDRMHEALGRPPTDPETSRYWAFVVAANRSRVRSGDPDLIYPGEVVTCPPVADAGF